MAPDLRNGAKSRAPNPSSLWETAHRLWQKSYAGDYLGLALLILGHFLKKFLSEPFYQTFTLDDVRIQHPFADPERVPVAWLFSLAGGLPLVVILLWTLLWRRDVHKSHITVLGLLISLFATLFLTDVFKDAVGRPRPDLLDRCQADSTTPQHELVAIEACTQTNLARLNDGFRSFPSGHSSFSWAGLGWLALFFASQTHVFRPRASLVAVILCLAPVLGAALIAISRLEDYRHGPWDVLAGSVLGAGVTYLNWRRYYPSLRSKGCDEPYTPSGSGLRSEFERVRDEEEGYEVHERFSIGEEEGEGEVREGNR